MFNEIIIIKTKENKKVIKRALFHEFISKIIISDDKIKYKNADLSPVINIKTSVIINKSTTNTIFKFALIF